MIIPRVLVRNKVEIVLVLIWISLFQFFLVIRPNNYASNCSWLNEEILEDNESVDNSYKVLVIADPQLIDNHTYPGRNPYLLSLSKHVVDSYIYTNYNSLVKNLKPESVIFLGDLLDNGRESTDNYYYREVVRFWKIFKRFGSIQDWFFHVPGNHDIGWANGVTEHSLNRFTHTFAKPNTLITKHNHDLIFFDSISYSNTENENIYQESHQFLQDLNNKEKQNPRLMFSHVPLFRPSDSNCGPYRESKNFPLSAGYQYQTVIDENYSKTILDSIKPDLLFSGDDHDYCEYFHDNKIPEITVKSISMAMGIKRPAVQLLTLFDKPISSLNPIKDHQGNIIKESRTYEYNICYLPKPYVDSIVYGMYAGIHILILFFLSIYKTNPYNQHRQSIRSRRVDISSLLNNYLHSTNEDEEEGEEGEEDSIPLQETTTTPPPPFVPTVLAGGTAPSIPNSPHNKPANALSRLNILQFITRQLVPQFLLVLFIYSLYNIAL